MKNDKTSLIDVTLAKKGMYWGETTPIGKYLAAGRDNIQREEMKELNPFLTRKVSSSHIKKTYTIVVKKATNTVNMVIHDIKR